VALLTEPVPMDIEMITKKTMIQNVVEKIGEIYKQIKKNEISPGTEYLFNNLEKQSNFEKSLRKMEMMDTMDFAKNGRSGGSGSGSGPGGDSDISDDEED
jgi:hypothetical protein